jgi:hypothetical protein
LAVLTETVRDAGVVPPVGVACSQTPPLEVTAAVNDIAALALEELDMLNVCEAGCGPPCWKVKVMGLGAATRLGRAGMFKVTGMAKGLLPAPDDVTVTVPLYMLPGSNPEVFTETVMDAGVVPLVALAESQLPPLDVLTEVVNDTAATELEELDRATACGPGCAPPCW